jgi:hypothetical protein
MVPNNHTPVTVDRRKKWHLIYGATVLALASVGGAGWYRSNHQQTAAMIKLVAAPEAVPATMFDASQPQPLSATAQRPRGRLDD